MRFLHNHPTTLKTLTNTTFITEAAQNKWFESLAGGSSRYYVIEEDGRLIALMRLLQIDSVNHCAGVGIDVMLEHRSRGYGKRCLSLLLRYCFEELNLNMVWLLTASFNEVAQRLYRSLGFQHTGYLPQMLFRGGEYHNVEHFALLRSGWMTQHKNTAPEGV